MIRELFTMKSLVYSGIATAALVFAVSSATASDSFAPVSKATRSSATAVASFGPPEMGGPVSMPSMPPMMGGGHGPMPGMPPMMGGGHGPNPGMPPMMGGNHNNGPHVWGPNIGGRWQGGYNAPGGWNAYRPAFRGYIMPRYWVNPTFLIGNYSNYGLRAPSQGYNWYRYYNDAVLSDPRGYVYDSVPGVEWDRYNSGYAPDNRRYTEPEYGPAIRPDDQAYDWNDQDNLAYSSRDGSKYDYDGNWQGDYVDPQGRVFEGEWNGTVTRYDDRDPGARPHSPAPQVSAPYPAQPAYGPENRGYGYARGYAQCLESNGLTGAAIGAILGGFAGNRIAGRGNRTGGTILGAGLGGLAGVAAEKAMKKCRHYEPRGGGYNPQPNYPRQPYPSQPYPQQYYPNQQGGYYYYPQAAPVITTVTIIPGGSSTTTTTTEEITYETVYSRPHRPVVHHWKPAPKPRPRPRCDCSIQGS
jgi:Nickel/cobalt transporter regulator/Glycine zipper 2TM domain